ncbi:MAG: hypothetical protein EP338_09935 [Bacteroidetes bacterium]|nr:MAG: hypothetical protein EP338_09935 [Bacteroidota bacterium]
MERRIIIIVLLTFIGLFAQSQTTIHGYCKYYESEDSTATMNRYFSTEILNDHGKTIYKKTFPLGNPDSEYRIEYNIGNSNNRIYESVIGTDTARYYYIHDTVSKLSYIIAGDDTTFIFKTKYENNLMVESICLYGCTYRDLIGHNAFGAEDTVLTIWEKGDTSYSIRVYDEKNRQILFKSFLDSPQDISSMVVKTEYNDSLNTRAEYYGAFGLPDWEKNNQIDLVHLNDHGVPFKRELVFTINGKREYFLIEYQVE